MRVPLKYQVYRISEIPSMHNAHGRAIHPLEQPTDPTRHQNSKNSNATTAKSKTHKTSTLVLLLFIHSVQQTKTQNTDSCNQAFFKLKGHQKGFQMSSKSLKVFTWSKKVSSGLQKGPKRSKNGP